MRVTVCSGASLSLFSCSGWYGAFLILGSNLLTEFLAKVQCHPIAISDRHWSPLAPFKWRQWQWWYSNGNNGTNGIISTICVSGGIPMVKMAPMAPLSQLVPMVTMAIIATMASMMIPWRSSGDNGTIASTASLAPLAPMVSFDYHYCRQWRPVAAIGDVAFKWRPRPPHRRQW